MASIPNALSLKAGKDMSLMKVSSANSTVTLESGQAITLQSATAKGALSVTAGTGILASSLVSTSASINAISARGGLQSQTVTGATGVRLKATIGDLNVNALSTTAGNVVLDAGALITLGSVTTPGLVDISAGTGLSAASLVSTGSNIDVDSDAGLLSITKATAKTDLDAQAVLGALNVGTFTAVTALLKSGSDMSLTTGTTTGVMKTDSKGAASLGNLTAGAQLTADATGAMTMTSARGTVLDMSAGTGLTAGTLTSTTGKIDVDSAAGLLKITTATAKTDLDAQAVLGALNVGSFTGATALIRSGTDMTLTTGTTTGALTTDSKGAASLGNLTAGAQLTADATGAMTVTSARGTVLDMSAGTGLTAGTLTSTTGKIDVDSAAGLLKITTATAKTDLDAQAVAGALTVGTFTAVTAQLKSGTDMALTTGTTTGILTTDSKGAASLGNLTAGAQLTADATGAMTVTSAKGTVLDMSAGTGLTAGTLTSTTGNIDVDSTTGTLKITAATAKTLLDAQAMAGDLTVGTFTAATAALVSGNNTAVSTGTTTGEMLATVGRNAALGSLTSSGDKVKVDATGTLTVTTAKAATQVDLSGRAGLTATTLTSTNAFIDVDSLAGSVNVKTANARTYFNANSYGAMTLGTFGVTAGYASLVSGGAMAITTGTSSGNMTIDGGTNAALGTLTSSAGQIDASALDGGMTFATLRAASKIKLDASKAWSSGQAISGTALYVSNGGLDLLATSGGISLSTLSGKTQSLVKTNAGSIKISSIQGFSPANLLTVTAVGGVKTVPVTYR
jgi:hypothetical protein